MGHIRGDRGSVSFHRKSERMRPHYRLKVAVIGNNELVNGQRYDFFYIVKTLTTTTIAPKYVAQSR